MSASLGCALAGSLRREPEPAHRDQSRSNAHSPRDSGNVLALLRTCPPVADLLTLEDVAHELRVTTKTVEGYILAGALRAVHGVGRGAGYRIKREWLDEFMASREVVVRRPEGRGSAAARRSHAATGPRAVFRSVAEARRALGLDRGRGR
ncbi:MAG: helix-turn-helix domain-containing protein [Polyangiales bacterium]